MATPCRYTRCPACCINCRRVLDQWTLRRPGKILDARHFCQWCARPLTGAAVLRLWVRLENALPALPKWLMSQLPA